MTAMSAEERGMELMHVPLKDLPPLALGFAKQLCYEVGGCMEVFLSAYATYAQCVEGLLWKDDLYSPRAKDVEWFRSRVPPEKIVFCEAALKRVRNG